MENNMKIKDGVLVRYIDTPGVTELIIPDNVIRIADYSFNSCENLISVTVPDTVMSIGNWAFYRCKNLISVIIPDTVMSIGKGAFSCCTSLSSINIPNSVVSIGNSAFYLCESLVSINIPNTVKKIGLVTFARCCSLTSIHFPDSVKCIEAGAFQYCKNLKTKKANYKAFGLNKGKLMCRNYEYNEGEWAKNIDSIVLCERGYHFCDNLFAIFNHYFGRIDKDFVIYECEVGEKIKTDGVKSVTNTIKPVKRLYRTDIIRILNEGDENKCMK